MFTLHNNISLHSEREWRKQNALYMQFNDTKDIDDIRACSFLKAYSFTYNNDSSIDLESAEHRKCSNTTSPQSINHNITNVELVNFVHRTHFLCNETITDEIHSALLYYVHDNNAQHILRLLHANETHVSHTVSEVLAEQISSLNVTTHQFQNAHNHTVISFTQTHSAVSERVSSYLYIDYRHEAVCVQSALRDFAVPLTAQDVFQDSASCFAITTTDTPRGYDSDTNTTRHDIMRYAAYSTVLFLSATLCVVGGMACYFKSKYDKYKHRRYQTKTFNFKPLLIQTERYTQTDHRMRAPIEDVPSMLYSLGDVIRYIVFPNSVAQDDTNLVLQDTQTLIQRANTFANSILTNTTQARNSAP